MNERDHSRNQNKILVVDDDVYLLAAIHQTLTLHDYVADTFDKPADALEAISKGGYMTVIADVRMPKMDGLQLFELIKATDPELPVIMMTGHGDVAMAVNAMKNGAYDFLEKPVDSDVMLAAVSRAVEKRRLVQENRSLNQRLQLAREERTGLQGLIGRHPTMQRLYDKIEVLAGEDDTVFIYGETGTGKELVAWAIHDLSERRDKPFVPVNMGAFPGEMLESELFGFKKGAFTGATRDKIGKFEYAGEGTIFLDEICTLPIHLQGKLLRVLEERIITRLGSNASIPVRARIITATNRRLEEEINKGAFRQDLYFRLNVLPLELPPLRDRRSDIPLLVEHFREEYCRDRKEAVGPLDQKILDLMMRKDWPGNVRELRNDVRRLCVYRVKADTLTAAGDLAEPSLLEPSDDMKLKSLMETAERQHIVEVLNRHQGHIVQTHKALGISRKCLYDKIRKYGLDTDAFRKGGRG